MDWMYLFYFLLATLIFFGARLAHRGEWNEEYTSLEQTKVLQGVMALGIALHHMAQKTCAPWHPSAYTEHGLDVFVPLGYLFVGVFLFCSGLGLYRSFRRKPGYLKDFSRRRILPIVIAFYLSEFLFTALRLAMGEKMDAATIAWYLSGLHMANPNAWYVIVIPFFYLAFRTAFRFCKREGTAILWVFLFSLGYTVLGSFVEHQNNWWMRGEWWYNSILLFPLGLLFGRHEKRVTAFLKKGYLFWLILSFAAIFLLFWQSEWLNGNGWGYYDALNNPMRIPHRLMSAALQWLVTIAFVTFCFLATMKVRLGNGALAWLGGATLEFYLVHGAFVELFGYNFLDISKSLVYIRSVPLYIAAVLGCSVPAALLFRLAWKRAVGLTRKKEPGGEGDSGPAPAAAGRSRRLEVKAASVGKGRVLRFLLPVVAALLLLSLGFMLLSFFGGDDNVRVMSGMEFRVPEGFTKKYSDRQYAVWEYTAGDRRPGNLILDGEIRDGIAGDFTTADEVLAECTWLTEAELYVNPQGVRMARGYIYYSGIPERRYYIESSKFVVLMCMREDERYCSRDDCEAALLQVAESVRPAK